MHKGTRTLVLVGIFLAVIIITGGITAGAYAWRFSNATKNISVDKVKFSGLSDGKYYGSFKVYHVSSEVEVTVKDGIIVDIYLMETSTNKNKEEGIAQRVIKEQSLDVDTVTGATISQKAVLKAVENALEGKPK